MGICPHCRSMTLVGHFYAKSWRVELAIDDPEAADPLPIPFWAEHGHHLFPERGKHALNMGLTCHAAAIAYAANVFPEARIVQAVACDILGDDLNGSNRCVVPCS